MFYYLFFTIYLRLDSSTAPMNHGEDHPKTNVSEASDTRSGNVKTELATCRNVDSFTKFDRIGEGTYGLVYRAIDKTTNKLVALKR